MISSTVDSSGMLIVFEIAPEMNGWTAAIMCTWTHVLDENDSRSVGRKLVSKYRKVLFLQVRGSLGSACGVDVVDDIFHLAGFVTELDERLGNCVVDDLDNAAADQFSCISPRASSGSIPVVSQSIMKPMVACRRDYRCSGHCGSRRSCPSRAPFPQQVRGARDHFRRAPTRRRCCSPPGRASG